MSSALPYDVAYRVAGELFGNLFRRNGDPAGHRYALEALTTGTKSPRMLVKEFCTSEEFRELHLMNETPNELARKVILRLLGEKRSDPKKAKHIATRMLQDDWRVVMKDLIDSPEYSAAYGDLNIPSWP
jgi:hypothetical protein